MLVSVSFSSFAQNNDREIWTQTLYKMAHPILEPMSEGRLKQSMEVELSPTWDGRDVNVAYMESFGRLMAGLAPWLTLPDDKSEEGRMRAELRSLALKSYKNAVDPESPDYLLWRNESQPLVDAAFIAQSFLRAYDRLWLPLDTQTQQRYIDEFIRLRRIDIPYNNWVLFYGTIETFLKKVGADYDRFRIQIAIRKTEEWYVGDGWYADGPEFAFDYYNGFVIQPMYLDILKELTDSGKENYGHFNRNIYKKALKRMQRYGVILERLISPEGTFPAVGRSITYRTGAFQPLAWLAQENELPEELSNGQVRSALTALIGNMFLENQNYHKSGYLNLGFNGHQPRISDVYTNNGSLYLAPLIYLPLGLPDDHPFWADEAEDWTTKKAWSQKSFPKDGAFHER